MIPVAGHVQCSLCHTVVESCCEGERYEGGLRAGEYTATHTGPLTRQQLES